MPLVAPIRNPYPIPDVSSEGFWLPRGPVLGERVQLTDKYWSAKVQPHERLFAHHTLSSIRKDIRFVETKAPADSLDLLLAAAYVHSDDTLVPKMYVSMQPEALGVETWRVLRNEVKEMPPSFGIPETFYKEPSGPERRMERGEKEWKKASASADGPSSSGGTRAVDERTEDRETTKSKIPPGSKKSAKSKMAATRTKAKAGGGGQAGSRGKTGAGGGTSAPAAAGKPSGGNSKMAPAGRKAAEGESGRPTVSATGAGAGTAPPQLFYEVATTGLHKYAGESRFVGIPDRVERVHHSVLKMAIEGPHSEQTRAGFSRKHDGTFYGV